MVQSTMYAYTNVTEPLEHTRGGTSIVYVGDRNMYTCAKN
jgi:hypothetical protein